MSESKQFWFPAKSRGWGWGMPTTWQGRVVLGVFYVLLAAGLFLFPPLVNYLEFITYVLVVSAGFFIVCYVKGERPSWRLPESSIIKKDTLTWKNYLKFVFIAGIVIFIIQLILIKLLGK